MKLIENVIIQQLISRSLWIKEFLYKFSLVLKVFGKKRISWIETLNIVLLILVDVLLGICISKSLKSTVGNFSDFERLLKFIVDQLLILLTWLSGAPAGLKLNPPLNSLLHRFYSYHINLWQGYTGLLEPILRCLYYGIVNLGFFGFTIQLAIAKDLLTLTTFHVYCLYIYATRLFNIELNTLRSLGRLIFARKWNPLRERVDSVTLSVSEMFIGASGLTIAMFLLPTICIYYIVFLTLRLPLFILESTAKCIIQLFNSIEIVTAFLIFSNSSLIANEVYLKEVNAGSEKTKNVINQYEVCTQIRSKQFYNVPNIGKSLMETLSKIVESKIITE